MMALAQVLALWLTAMPTQAARSTVSATLAQQRVRSWQATLGGGTVGLCGAAAAPSPPASPPPSTPGSG
ncbi:MAG: hypothetical protein IPG50_38700 [Myxococcales bacterium]|nr:hypothetical protein [Myxococcales bacterium]